MFRRYPDITNVKPRFLADIRNSAPSVDEEFQVTEKVHGASLQVYTDGVVTHAASRNQDLGPIATASLFGAHELIASLNEPLQRAWELVRLECPGVKVLYVYGELFGGVYQCAGVKGSTCSAVQNGQLQYTPRHGFYLFDMMVVEEGGMSDTSGTLDTSDISNTSRRTLDKDTLHRLGVAAGFEQPERGFLVEHVEFRGPLDACLAFSGANKGTNTSIPRRFGLPEREVNVREGYVIAPIHARWLTVAERGCDRQRVIIKDKNVFAGNGFGAAESAVVRAPPPTLDADEQALLKVFVALITVDRYESVRSKVGADCHIGQLMSMLKDDVIDELKREGEDGEYERYTALDPKKRRIFVGVLVNVAREVVLREQKKANAPIVDTVDTADVATVDVAE